MPGVGLHAKHTLEKNLHDTESIHHVIDAWETRSMWICLYGAGFLQLISSSITEYGCHQWWWWDFWQTLVKLKNQNKQTKQTPGIHGLKNNDGSVFFNPMNCEYGSLKSSCVEGSKLGSSSNLKLRGRSTDLNQISRQGRDCCWWRVRWVWNVRRKTCIQCLL